MCKSSSLGNLLLLLHYGMMHLLCFGQWRRQWPPGAPSGDRRRPWQCDQFVRISRKAANREKSIINGWKCWISVVAWPARCLCWCPPRELFESWLSHGFPTLLRCFRYSHVQRTDPFAWPPNLIHLGPFRPLNFHIFQPIRRNLRRFLPWR